MSVGSVESLGEEAQNKVIKLSVSGLSHQSIADEINKDFNSDITVREVKEFLSRSRSKSAKILKEDKNFQSQLVQTYFDTVKQLTELNSEMWKFFYEVRKDPEFVDKVVTCPHCDKTFKVQMKNFITLLKTAEILLGQIRHVDAVLGKMQKKSLNIQYNYVDLSKKLSIVMPKLLDDMQKKGLIDIKKKRLKSFYITNNN